jgi:hypothetical protein
MHKGHFYNRIVHPSKFALRATLAALIWTLPVAADVQVTTLDGKEPLRGLSLGADAGKISLHSAEGPVVEVETRKVVEIVAVPQPASPPAAVRPFEVELVDGSRLRGMLDGGPEGALRLRSPVLRETVGQIDVPLDHVLAVRRVDGQKIPGASRLVRIPNRDAAYTLEGARLEGYVASFLATGVEVDRGELGARRITYDKLAAIFIDNETIERPGELHLVARLADGSAIVLTKAFRIAGGALSGTTPAGVSILVSVSHVSALGFQGGSFVHLSDLQPILVERQPFFDIPAGPAAPAMLDFVCPVRLDSSPDGRPITLQKRRYFKGIGVRPRTALTYDLGGRFARFEAICGVDDEVLGPGYGRGAGTGSVIFVVETDGKRVYESPPVVGGSAPKRVRVPVAGAKKLTLIVSLVPKEKMPKGREDSPELDNAVWARPLLIR